MPESLTNRIEEAADVYQLITLRADGQFMRARCYHAGCAINAPETDAYDEYTSSSGHTYVRFYGQEITFDSGSPGGAQANTIDQTGAVTAIACPSSSACIAVDNSDNEVAFDPSNPGTPAVTSLEQSGLGLIAVACPSTSDCITADAGGTEFTFNPSSPGTPTGVPTGDTGLTGFSCLSASFCVAIDATGE